MTLVSRHANQSLQQSQRMKSMSNHVPETLGLPTQRLSGYDHQSSSTWHVFSKEALQCKHGISFRLRSNMEERELEQPKNRIVACLLDSDTRGMKPTSDLSIDLCIYLSIYLPIYILYINIYIYIAAAPPARRPRTNLGCLVYPSIYIYLSIYPPIYLYLYLYLYWSIYIYILQRLHLPDDLGPTWDV